MTPGTGGDDTILIRADNENTHQQGAQPSTAGNHNIRNTIKIKYDKTKANIKSAGIMLERRKNRNDYEDLDKSHSTEMDPNFVLRSNDHTRIVDSSLKSNAYEHIINDSVCNKFQGRKDILVSSQSENAIHFEDNQSKMNLSTSMTAQQQQQPPPNVVIKDRERLRREHVWFIFFVFLYSIYLIIGSLCFQAIESPAERNATITVLERKNAFLRKYPQIFDDDLEDFLRAVIAANDRGISPLRNASNDLNWSFGQALFFSSTVVTTIGYGHVTPLSQTGKIFCMIYATIGIPLTLILLSAVVERLLIPANWLLGTLNSKLGHLYQPFNIRLLHLSIIVALIAAVFFAIPTVIFAYLEPAWGALDAFYYCFISLTTIGLGDYIPGEGVSAENRSLYKICITGYLVCGLIAMMFALTVFYDIPQLNLGQLFTENFNGETEKLRLSGNNTTCYSGPSGLYMPQRDEEVRRAVVRIRPHGDDSPSPDDAPSSLNRDMRIP